MQTNKIHYDAATIGQFSIGKVVRHKNSGILGHVSGFNINSSGEITIGVNWYDGYNFDIHPGNIEVL